MRQYVAARTAVDRKETFFELNTSWNMRENRNKEIDSFGKQHTTKPLGTECMLFCHQVQLQLKSHFSSEIFSILLSKNQHLLIVILKTLP